MYIPQKYNSQFGIPVILEFGSLNTRAGFAGKDRPDAIVPSYVAADKNTSQKSEMEFFAHKAKQNFNPQSILQNCMIEEWENAHITTQYLLARKLFVNPQQNPLFFVEPALSSKQNRQKMIQILFEDFGFNGLFMHKAPVLSTYLFAKQSALIVDIGAQYTHVVPVIEGFICSKAIMRAELGGQTLTRALYQIVAKKQKIMSRYTNRNSLTPKMELWGRHEIIREIKHQYCTLLEFKLQNLKFNEQTDKTVFELPDKTKLDLGRQIYSIPEMHFTEAPELNYRGLHNLIYQSFQKCEPEHRKQLFANIHIVGGGSAFPNFLQRLQKQLCDYDSFGYGNKLKIFGTLDKDEKFCSSWLGASIMASMSVFDKWIITKKEYEEHGAIQVEKKL